MIEPERYIEITIDFPVDATDEQILAKVKEAVLAADKADRAAGGNGLKCDEVTIRPAD